MSAPPSSSAWSPQRAQPFRAPVANSSRNGPGEHDSMISHIARRVTFPWMTTPWFYQRAASARAAAGGS